jgi:hypothetical protein
MHNLKEKHSERLYNFNAIWVSNYPNSGLLIWLQFPKTARGRSFVCSNSFDRQIVFRLTMTRSLQ